MQCANNELVKLAAVDKGLVPSTGDFVNAKGSGLTGTKKATGEGVTVGRGQYLAVMAVNPGVVTLTGFAKDGSGKKVTCSVTIRGQVTGLSLKELSTKDGLGQVELKSGEYESKCKPGGKLTLTPIVDINGIPGNTADKAEQKVYAGYKKYTDTSVSYRSSNAGVATVDTKGKITISKSAVDGSTVTIYATTADGNKTVQITITVVK
ncbi:MAG: hypothetical protein J5518_11760 [Lachnospiraceae bacterium]|nr:hypothetical protein [Lachnospiraceae bacterium]